MHKLVKYWEGTNIYIIFFAGPDVNLFRMMLTREKATSTA